MSFCLFTEMFVIFMIVTAHVHLVKTIKSIITMVIVSAFAVVCSAAECWEYLFENEASRQQLQVLVEAGIEHASTPWTGLLYGRLTTFLSRG